jgi:CheY-like chemotaxis protein
VRAAGASGYLTKPISYRQLGDVIEQTGRPIKRVLVVDDEAEVQELLTLSLRAYDEKIEVGVAQSGEQALEEMRRTHPDLVLLDVLMPAIDGWDVLAAKERDESLTGISVVMISGQDPREDPIRTRLLVATMGDGIGLSKLMACSRDLSTCLLQPD